MKKQTVTLNHCRKILATLLCCLHQVTLKASLLKTLALTTCMLFSVQKSQFTTQTIDDSIDVGWGNAPAINEQGNLLIAYQNYDENTVDLAICENRNCSIVTTQTIHRFVGQSNFYESGFIYLTLDQEDNPLVAYNTKSSIRGYGDEIFFPPCVDTACSAFETISWPTDLPLSPYQPSIQSDENHFFLFSSVDILITQAYFVRCYNFNCTDANFVIFHNFTNPISPDQAFTHLQLNNQSIPSITFYDDEIPGLKLVTCQDQGCTSFHIETLRTFPTNISSSSFIPVSSFAFNQNGYPVIAYTHPVSEQLEILFCLNAICDAKTMTTIDDVGPMVVHAPIALALRDDDSPVIVYHTIVGPFNELRIAVCHTPSCNPVNITVLYAYDQSEYLHASLMVRDDTEALVTYHEWNNLNLLLATYPLPRTPTQHPSIAPTHHPTTDPTSNPSTSPTPHPTTDPTPMPTPYPFQSVILDPITPIEESSISAAPQSHLPLTWRIAYILLPLAYTLFL